jgi:hypothetical protein
MEVDNKYKIYGLKSKNENFIRYVGYTKLKLTKRLTNHLTEARNRDTHKDRWIRSNNLNIDIVLIEENINSFELVLEREIYWIKKYKEEFNIDLVNSTNGGNGTVGRFLTEDQKINLRNKNLGKKLTDEHKTKISNSNIGRETSEETRLKQKISNLKYFLKKHNALTDNLSFEKMIFLKENIKNNHSKQIKKQNQRYYKALSLLKKKNINTNNLSKDEIIKLKNKILNKSENEFGVAKLNEEKVLQIRQMFNDGIGRKELAKMFNMEYSTICKIIIKKIWKNID